MGNCLEPASKQSRNGANQSQVQREDTFSQLRTGSNANSNADQRSNHLSAPAQPHSSSTSFNSYINAPQKKAIASQPKGKEYNKKAPRPPVEDWKEKYEKTEAELIKRTKEVDELKHDLKQKKFASDKDKKLRQEEYAKLQRSTKEELEKVTRELQEKDKELEDSKKEIASLQKNTETLISEHKTEMESRDEEISTLKIKFRYGEDLIAKQRTDLMNSSKINRSSSVDPSPSQIPKRVITRQRPVTASEANDKVDEEHNVFTPKLQKYHTEMFALSDANRKLKEDLDILKEKISRVEKGKEESDSKYEMEIAQLQEQIKAEIENRGKRNDNDLSDAKKYEIKSLKEIKDITEASRMYSSQVATFKGSKKDKHYLDLEEMLIRKLVELDNIESEGNLLIRQERKNALQEIQKYLNDLKHKANVSSTHL